jgi:hypothetical protein
MATVASTWLAEALVTSNYYYGSFGSNNQPNLKYLGDPLHMDILRSASGTHLVHKNGDGVIFEATA